MFILTRPDFIYGFILGFASCLALLKYFAPAMVSEIIDARRAEREKKREREYRDERRSLEAEYPFNPKYGFHISSSGVIICPKCLHESPPVVSRLGGVGGVQPTLFCPLCEYQAANPNRKKRRDTRKPTSFNN